MRSFSQAGTELSQGLCQWEQEVLGSRALRFCSLKPQLPNFFNTKVNSNGLKSMDMSVPCHPPLQHLFGANWKEASKEGLTVRTDPKLYKLLFPGSEFGWQGSGRQIPAMT